MSDPVSNHDIEDVLSSIRRLVAHGDPSRVFPPLSEASEDDAQADAPPKQERLVLTPALRVLTPDDEIEGGAAHPADQRGTPANASNEPRKAEPSEASGRASLEAKIAALEAAVSGVDDDFEPDGSENTAKPSLNAAILGQRDAAVEDDTATAGPEGALNDAVVDHIADTVAEEIAGAFPRLNAAEGPEDFDSQTVVPLNRDRHTAAATDTTGEAADEDVVVVAPKIHKPAAFRVAPPQEDPVEVETAEAPAEREELTPDVEIVTPTRAEAPSFRHAARDVYDPVAEATADAAEAEANGTDIYGDELAPDPEEPGTAVAEQAAPAALMDPDMLRDMVGQMIREELQGEMGERITRNVRKLVRREINRVLSAQEFD